MGLMALAVLPAPARNRTGIDSLSGAAARATTDTAKGRWLLALANAYGDDSVAREFYYANEALALAERSGWKEGKVYAEQILGRCYMKVRAYQDAILHLNRSRKAAREKGMNAADRRSLQFIVHCYHMLDSLKEAADCQKLLLDLTAETGDAEAECNQMSAYALRLSDMGRYAEAVGYLQKDIAIAQSRLSGARRTAMLGDLLNTLGTTFAKTASTDSALRCLRAASVYAKEAGNDGLSAYVLSSFCDVYTAAKAYDSAIWYGVQTFEQGKIIGDINLQRQYARVLSALFGKTGQAGPALLYHLASDSLSDIADNTQQTIEKAMEVAKVNMEGQAERDRLERDALEIGRKNGQAMLAAALIAVLALIFLSLFIYRSLRQKQKANRIIREQALNLQAQNEVIDRSLKEKEDLLKETHHRIKNNLQLISSLLELQVADVDKEETKAALRTAQRRIQSIATVHSKLYGSGAGERIECSAFVSDLFNRLSRAFGSDERVVQFRNSIAATMLPLNPVVLLGLILNELITNSFKHAWARAENPAISIALAVAGDRYTLQYSDNGCGLPDGAWEAPSGSLGLYLVKRMSKQLGGTAAYTFDGGSRFIISFHHAGD